MGNMEILVEALVALGYVLIGMAVMVLYALWRGSEYRKRLSRRERIRRLLMEG